MPKAQTITVKARGYYDYGNNPWTLPDGALTETDNVEIGADNVLTPRLGFAKLGSDSILGYARFGDYLIGWNGSALRYSVDIGSSWTALTGTVQAQATTPSRVGMAESARSLFVAARSGVLVLDAYTSNPVAAGVQGALDLSAAVAGAGTAVPNNTKVAYRSVFGRRDANGRVLLSAPSSRVVLTNTAGTTQNVTVVITIPTEVQNSTHFVQLYRTGASVDQNTDPGDECYLVYEAALSAVSTVTITDSTPDGLGGASLYTNPSQETILNGNDRPPLSYDVAEFGGALWYADVTSPARQIVNLLGVSGTNGLALNDTITVNGQVFTAKATETVASREFLLATTGTVDQNVRDTTASLIKCINRTASANAFAIDLSEPAPAGIPGVISIQRTDFTSSLTLAVSRATAWANIVATVAPVRNKNGLVYSKQGQPDQIPTAIKNAPILVGSAADSILRVVPTRNALWVLKADGVWRVTGSAGQFEVQPFDPTMVVIAPSAAVQLDNMVYCLTDQGFVRISESGVELISRPIERVLNASVLSLLTTEGWSAVARESDHKYLVSTGFVTLQFDNLVDAWTLDSIPAFTAGIVDRDSKRLLLTRSGVTYRQRRGSDAVWYGDDDQSCALSDTAVLGADGLYTVHLAADPSPALTAGDLLYQSATGAKGVVVSYDTATNALVLSGSIGAPGPASLTATTATLYQGYNVRIGLPVRTPAPGSLAEWQELAILYVGVYGYQAQVGFTGDNGTSGVTLDKASNTGAARQIRAWPGPGASFSSSMAVLYAERVASVRSVSEIGGFVWTFSPQGDGVSR